jgi:hypothetical protein
MKGVLDNCWVVFSLDGFGSHLDAEWLMFFHVNKILVIKEEGDTSQVCQAYNQIVAKEDKRCARYILEMIKLYKKTVINECELIAIINEALNKVAETKAWQTSFVRVNFCPSQ